MGKTANESDETKSPLSLMFSANAGVMVECVVMLQLEMQRRKVLMRSL